MPRQKVRAPRAASAANSTGAGAGPGAADAGALAEAYTRASAYQEVCALLGQLLCAVSSPRGQDLDPGMRQVMRLITLQVQSTGHGGKAEEMQGCAQAIETVISMLGHPRGE